jgi:hypothetical protein
MLFDGWQGFLVESKCWRDKVGFGPVARLHVLVEQRQAVTLGLFFSAFGFTAAAADSAELLRPIRVLLFDQHDIEFGIRTAKSMRDTIHQKWLLALKFGRPNLPVSEPLGVFSAKGAQA